MSKGCTEANPTALYTHRPYPPDACAGEGQMLMFTIAMQTAGAVTNIKIKNVIDYRFQKKYGERYINESNVSTTHCRYIFIYTKKGCGTVTPCTSPQ